jgi:flagellin
LDREVQSLKQEIDRISQVTNYNGTVLLGGQGEGLTFQVGTDNNELNRIVFDPSKTNVQTNAIGIESLAINSKEGAWDSLGQIDSAINKVNENRSELGAMQSRLQSSATSLGIAMENLSEAKSRIADTDIAAETSVMIKNQILQNAGVSVLAQANTAPQGALKLL